MTTLPFLLLALSFFVIFNSDCVLISCLLCKSNTLWNIFIILVRNVEQDKMRCVQKWQLWLSYFWSFLPLFCFWNGFRVCNLNTLQSILVVLGRNVEQDVSHTRMISLPFLLLALSPFVIFDSDYALISSPLCKSNTLWNIFMILGRNVEQNEMTCPYKNDNLFSANIVWQLYRGKNLICHNLQPSARVSWYI